MEDLEKRLIETVGGMENLTTQKEILIRSTVRAYGVMILAELFVNKIGTPLRPDMARKGILEFHPVLGKSYLAYANTIRQNLLALGLDAKKSDRVLDLGKYVKETYGPEEESKK